MIKHQIKLCAALLVLLGSFSASPQAHAQWGNGPSTDDRIDEAIEAVEEANGASTQKPLLVSAVSLAVATTAIVISTRRGDDDPDEESDNDESARSQASADANRPFQDRKPKTLDERLTEARRQMPVDVVMGLQPTGPKKHAVVMGVSVRF